MFLPSVTLFIRKPIFRVLIQWKMRTFATVIPSYSFFVCWSKAFVYESNLTLQHCVSILASKSFIILKSFVTRSETSVITFFLKKGNSLWRRNQSNAKKLLLFWKIECKESYKNKIMNFNAFLIEKHNFMFRYFIYEILVISIFTFYFFSGLCSQITNISNCSK
jgi:hypothetical protein